MAKKIQILLCVVFFLLIPINGHAFISGLWGAHVNMLGDVLSLARIDKVTNDTSGEFSTVSSVSIDSANEKTSSEQFDIAVLLGIEILRMLDIYGKFGYAYSQQTQKFTSLKHQLMMKDHSLFFDANARVLFPVSSFISAYMDVGGGINFEIYKIVEYTSIDSYGWTQNLQAIKVYDKNHELTRLNYLNIGVGAAFLISSVDRIGIGYSAKYYFSSLFNKEMYKLRDNAGTSITFNFSDSQFFHGISIEYIRLF